MTMAGTAWWHDFRYARGAVHVKKTGIAVPLGAGVVGETASWLAYYLRIEAERAAIRADGARIWFAPDRPRPWYLVWPVMQLAGLRLAAHPGEADLAFMFEDRTITAPVRGGEGLPAINAGCLDVSKSHVARVFEEVFGRALVVDPESWTGPMVRKSQTNGVHDGAILHGPQPCDAGYCYQRLIETGAQGMVEDLRCPTVGGEIPVVFVKRRQIERRFANANAEVSMACPDAVFSREERARLATFCRAMKLDWGGLDVLRERGTGDLYVVDVNKTDMGPPIALPLKHKLQATRILARSLRDHVDEMVSRSR